MRVVLADSQARVRSALRFVLDQERGYDVVGEASDAASLMGIVRATAPHVVILDWNLPGLAESHRLDELRRLAPHAKVIALSGQPEHRDSALRAGVLAFVSKTEPPESLIAALQVAQTSQLLLSRGE